MKKICSIGFWFRNEYHQGTVYLNKQTAFSEYHVSFDNNQSLATLLTGYHFIEGFDGSLELNKAPETSLHKEFLEEVGAVIEDVQKRLVHNETNVFSDHVVNFFTQESSPSAAA